MTKYVVSKHEMFNQSLGYNDGRQSFISQPLNTAEGRGSAWDKDPRFKTLNESVDYIYSDIKPPSNYTEKIAIWEPLATRTD